MITFNLNIGTVAYDSDVIIKMQFSKNCGIEITYAVSGKGNATPVIQTDRYYITEPEYKQVLEQWKKSKETSK
jgi:hypothetical protein